MSEKTKSFEITLSGEALAWLEAEIADGNYASPSAMIEALILRDWEEIAGLLREGEHSGLSPRSLEDVIEGIRQRRHNAA